jgi:hypothetical protein
MFTKCITMSAFIPQVPADGRTYILNGRGNQVWWDSNESIDANEPIVQPEPEPEPPVFQEPPKKYMVIMAGQSNCQSSNTGPLTAEERIPNPKIKAYHRGKTTTYKSEPITNYTVLPKGQLGPAVDPIQHHGISHPESVGFWRTFAESFLADHPNSELIIMPTALGGTGFIGSTGYVISWDKTITWAHKNLYSEMISDCNDVLKSDPSIEVLGLLFAQGESDIGNPNYQFKFDTFIKDFRNDLWNGKGKNTPFVCSTMMKSWKDMNAATSVVDNIHKLVQWRFNDGNTICAWLDHIKNDVEVNDSLLVHYNAKAQRLMGLVFYDAYKKLKYAVPISGASGSRSLNMDTPLISEYKEPNMTFEQACSMLAMNEGKM